MLFSSSCCVFFFKQKTAYAMRISDWSSDVCSSDLLVIEDVVETESDMLCAHEVGNVSHVAQVCFGRIVVVAEEDPDPADVDHATSGRTGTNLLVGRSEERRVGKECVSTCRSRWSPEH